MPCHDISPSFLAKDGVRNVGSKPMLHVFAKSDRSGHPLHSKSVTTEQYLHGSGRIRMDLSSNIKLFKYFLIHGGKECCSAHKRHIKKGYHASIMPAKYPLIAIHCEQLKGNEHLLHSYLVHVPFTVTDSIELMSLFISCVS